MRKMKKINGYLVVRFNDREKREYEGTGLGSFGVIDAELYTGILDIDRSVMEYDGAETLEEAVEQARDLESELDVEEPEVKITVVIEGEQECSEEDVEPEALFRGRKTELAEQLKSGHFADLDPRTAAHELHGYARALEDLGMIDGHDERYQAEPGTFGVGFAWSRETGGEPEEALAYICDELCKYREGRTQEELDAICEKCRLGRRAGDPPALPPIWPEGEKPDPYRPWNKRAERVVQRLALDIPEPRDLQQLRKLLKEIEDFASEAEPAGPEPPRDNFKHYPESGGDYLAFKVYRLGLKLEEACPANDCELYRNISRMARELDGALDEAQGYAAEVLQRELGKHVRELRRMYYENCAVKAYRREVEA